ncbi:mCG142215, isoform CRA_c [Mus musculus]|nr:mCG142215, isoform CRA_c [Mus musculus]
MIHRSGKEANHLFVTRYFFLWEESFLLIHSTFIERCKPSKKWPLQKLDTTDQG